MEPHVGIEPTYLGYKPSASPFMLMRHMFYGTPEVSRTPVLWFVAIGSIPLSYGGKFFGVASRPRTDFHKVHNLAAYLFASDHHINLVGDTGIEPAYRAAPNRTCLHDRSPEICAQSHQGLFNL